jgi:membrane fusion protein (multidrug efflux system)
MKTRFAFDRTSLLGSILLATLATAAGCGSGDARSEASQPDAETAAAPAVSVEVAELVPESLVEEVELSGELEPWVHVSVAAELGGTVEMVGFREGEHVKTGQVLARVGTDLFEAALDEARARLEAAQAVHEKTAELFKRQHVPRQELIAATSSLHAAAAQVKQAELRLERSIIEAPISGVATTREIEPGEVLSPGAPITELYRVDRLKAVAGIPENDIAVFRVGGAATIEVDAFAGRTFLGRIHLIGPAAQGPSRTFPVEIAIENPTGELRPGMIARVALVKRTLEDVIVLERDVLQDRDSGPVAIVARDGVARVREVTLGASQGNRVVVENGLEPGEMLIVTGQRGLIDGQPVDVVEHRP